MSGRILVIGIGHRLRRDDGVGPIVLDRLRARGADGPCLLELGGEGAGLIEAWDGWDGVIVVDAMRSGRPPGTVVCLDAADGDIPAGTFRSSSHQFGLADAIAVARTLGRLPRSLRVVGVEGECFGFGEGLTPAVATAVEAVVAQVQAAAAGLP